MQSRPRMKTDIEKLFEDTLAAFNKAPIKRYADEQNLKWYYSISSTKLTPNTNVIVGFNWGAGINFPHEAQTEAPKENFKDLFDKNDLGSLQRVYKPLKAYLPEEDIDNCVQTNFCFFRSKNENEITPADLKLSTPLFNKLIQILSPKRIIGFSKKLSSYCLEQKLCSSIETFSFPSNKRTLSVTKGLFEVSGQQIPIYFLPHPNAKFTSAARENSLNYCFKSN